MLRLRTSHHLAADAFAKLLKYEKHRQIHRCGAGFEFEGPLRWDAAKLKFIAAEADDSNAVLDLTCS
jgi:hypothetical protein